MELQTGDVIYGIPDALAHKHLLNYLSAVGHIIHAVMDNNDFNEYPHIHNSGSYIGGTKAKEFSSGYNEWIHYNDFIFSIKKSKNPCKWKEELSNQFNEKINDCHKL